MKINAKELPFYIQRGAETFFSYWSGYHLVPKPSVMYFELTYRCNCRCQFCERWKVGPKLAKEELNTKEVKHLLMEAKSIGVRNVGFTGGEPLLRQDLFTIGKFAKKIGLNTVLATNGTLVNSKNINQIAEIFDSVAISMDGITPQTHDYLRGVKGVYQAAMRTIMGLKKRGVPVTVNMVINQKNFMEINRYIEFFSQREIPLQLTPVHEYEESYFRVKKVLKKVDAKKFKKEWQKLSSKYSFLHNGFYRHIPTFFSQPKKLKKAYVCFAGSVMFFVNPYGDVFPCEFYRIKMGNIRKEPLSLIWKKAKKLRQKISSSERPCLCWNHCVVPLADRLTRFVALKKGF